MKNIVMAMVCIIAFLSCNSNSDTAAAAETEMTAPENKFSKDSVDNKRDFICNMPVTAGIADTCHYDNKVYGFCSEECKVEFLSDPKKYLAEIK